MTAFPPFSNFKTNVSQQLLELFENRGIIEYDIDTILLSVDEKGSSEVSELLKSGKRWDAIIQLGLAARRQKISLEKYAMNKSQFKVKDNSNRRSEGVIIPGADELQKTTASIHVLDEEFEDENRVVWSNDAGGFVCNETMFRTLNTIREFEIDLKSGKLIPAIFIHLPPSEFIDLESQFDLVKRAVKTIANRPILEVVGALIRDSKGRILSCRRPSNDVWGGWWEFPGGKVDVGEKQSQALRREIMEELCIEVNPRIKLASISHDYEDRHVDLHIWDCGVHDPSSIKLLEHDEVRWLDISELDAVNWLPADVPLIKEWMLQGIPYS